MTVMDGRMLGPDWRLFLLSSAAAAFADSEHHLADEGEDDDDDDQEDDGDEDPGLGPDGVQPVAGVQPVQPGADAGDPAVPRPRRRGRVGDGEGVRGRGAEGPHAVRHAGQQLGDHRGLALAPQRLEADPHLAAAARRHGRQLQLVARVARQQRQPQQEGLLGGGLGGGAGAEGGAGEAARDGAGRPHQREVEVGVAVLLLHQHAREVPQPGGGVLHDHAHPAAVLQTEPQQRALPVLHLHVAAPHSHTPHEGVEVVQGATLAPAQLRLVNLDAGGEGAPVSAPGAALHLRAEGLGELLQAGGHHLVPAARLHPAQLGHVPPVQLVDGEAGEEGVAVGGAPGVQRHVPAGRHQRAGAGAADLQAHVPVDGGAGVEVHVVGAAVHLRALGVAVDGAELGDDAGHGEVHGAVHGGGHRGNLAHRLLLELETKAMRRFAKISQSQRRPLLSAYWCFHI